MQVKEDLAKDVPITTVRAFSVNFQQLALALAFNQLLVLDGEHTFQTIDTLTGHAEEIVAFDVSQVQKIIASISAKHLCIHCLVDSEPAQNYLKDVVETKVQDGEQLSRSNLLQLLQGKSSQQSGSKLRLEPFSDFAVYTGRLRWILTYKIDLSPELPAKTLAMSQMGDFFVIAGKQNLAVWGQEAQLDTYMQQILYSKEEKPNQFASVRQELDTLTGEIIQVEIAGSGRLIVSLEKGSPTLKVWHQEEAQESNNEPDNLQMRRQQFNMLEVYELPRAPGRQNPHNVIDCFHLLHQEFNHPWIQPVVIVTIKRATQQAAIWVESLTDQSLSFSCVSVVSPTMLERQLIQHTFDALFLQTYTYHHRAHTDDTQKWHSSPLLEPSRDKELYFKKIYQEKNEHLGMIPSKWKSRGNLSLNPHTTLLDWLLVLTHDRVILYKCTALRNFPQQSSQVELVTIASISTQAQSLLRPWQLQSALQKNYNDQISLVCTNKQGQAFKLWFQPSDGGQSTVRLEASNMVLGTANVQEVLPHPQLEVVALIQEQASAFDEHQVQFFFQSEYTHPVHGKPELVYLGNYGSKLRIVSAAWVPGTLMMAVLFEDQTMAVVTQMKFFKAGGLCTEVEALQQELCRKGGLMSPTGEIHSTEPIGFEAVFQVRLEVAKCVKIMALGLEQKGRQQIFSFAAINEAGKQQVCTLRWDIIQKPQPFLGVSKMQDQFKDGFKLHRVVATNEAMDTKSLFALLIIKKEQQQQIINAQRRGPEKKPLCKLVLVEYTLESINEVFSIDGSAEELLERPVSAKFSKSFLGVQLSQGDFRTEGKHLYIYDLIQKSYRGFFDLTAVTFGQTKHIKSDFYFLEEEGKGSVVYFVENDVYILGPSERSWRVERTIKGFFNHANAKSISVQALASKFKNTVLCVVDGRHIKVLNDADIIESSQPAEQNECLKLGNFRENSMHNLFIKSQKSLPLFFPALLEELYIKGYANLVAKLLVLMHEALIKHKESSELVSDYINMDLSGLLTELQQSAEAYVLASGGGQVQAAATKKKASAFSAFDAFDESEESEEEKGGKGDEVSARDFNKEFKESVDDFLKLVQERAMFTFGLGKQDTLDLISFILRFQNVFEKDFYADTLASMLLRKIFIQSEKVEQSTLDSAAKEIAYHLGETDDSIPVLAPEEEKEDSKAPKGFSMEEFMAQKLSGGGKQSAGELSLCKDWTSEMVAMALHSDNQDVILDMLSERFNFNDNLTWSLMRRLSIPLWCKNVTRLKNLIELVVKNEYRLASTDDQTRPKCEVTAIWYILLNKLSILQKLYKVAPGQEKFAEFFSKNFDDKKVQVIAGKNAAALVPKKKFHLSMGFFLLGQDLQGAVQIALSRTKDPVLAVLMCKIHDPANEKKVIDGLLDSEFIKRGEAMNDPYLMSTGMWLRKEFLKAVNLLSPTQEDDCLKYIFNPGSSDFNLCPHLERPVEEIDSKVQKGQNFSNIEKEEEVVIYPLISQRSYMVLDLVKKLQKAPDVKRMLNKDWTLDKKKGQKSIFDDFFEEEESSEEEVAPKETITVDEAKMLSFAVDKALQQKMTVLGLLLLEEQQALRQKLGIEQKLRMARTLLRDFIVDYIAQKTKRNQSGSVQVVLQNLAQSLGVKADTVADFLLRLCRQLGLVQLEIELLTELDTLSQTDSMYDLIRIYEESQKLEGFVQSMSRCGGFLLDCQDIDIDNNERLLGLTRTLERLIDCHMLQSSKKVPQGKKSEPLQQNRPSQASQDDWDVMEFDDDDSNKRDVQSGITNQMMQASTSRNFEEIAQRQREVQLRFLSMLLILMSVFQVCLLCNKHGLLKEVFAQIQVLLQISANFSQPLSDGTIQASQFDQINQLFKYQATKIVLKKLEQTLVRNQEWGLTAIKMVKDQASLMEAGGEINRRKVQRDIRDERNPAETQFARVWLKTVSIMQLMKIFNEKKLDHLKYYNFKLQGTHILISEVAAKTPPKHVPFSFDFTSAKLDNLQVLRCFLQNESSLSLGELTSQVHELSLALEQATSHLFQRYLSLGSQHGLVQDLDVKRLSYHGQVFVGSYFFPTEGKFRDFCVAMELTNYCAPLQDHHLSLLKQIKHSSQADDDFRTGKSPATAQPQRMEVLSPMKTDRRLTSPKGQGTKVSMEGFVGSKLQSGIEVFKQPRETVSDFCFDHTQGDAMAFAMQARGMREIPIQNTLVYRNRAQNGFEIIDEELYSWSDMLHRYDQLAIIHKKLQPKSDAVKAAVHGLYQRPSTFGTRRVEKRRRNFLLDEELNPQIYFGDDQSFDYCKARSNLDVTHEDYSNAIESHPKLPLYVTGNSKGLLCLWSFGQVTDKSLNQWILDPDTPPAQANPKKSTVKKIAFSDSGDKIAAMNMEGALYLMTFDLQEQTTLFDTQQMTQNKEMRLTDFQFVDGDNLVAVCSLKDKMVQVLDTMLPPRQSSVLQCKSGNGGNLLTVNYNKQRVYCFNSKPGVMGEYDLRMMKDAVTTQVLGKEEVTAVTVDPVSDALIVGFNDGVVRIYDEEKRAVEQPNQRVGAPVQYQTQFAARETINAFTNIEGKKKTVTQVKVHPENGGLFASAAGGVIKLLRLQA